MKYIVLFCVIAVFITIRDNVAFNNRYKILCAIHDYLLTCIGNDEIPKVDYNDMESYEKTMFRFWDFGCKHILPDNKFEVVESFIKHKG